MSVCRIRMFLLELRMQVAYSVQSPSVLFFFVLWKDCGILNKTILFDYY